MSYLLVTVDRVMGKARIHLMTYLKKKEKKKKEKGKKKKKKTKKKQKRERETSSSQNSKSWMVVMKLFLETETSNYDRFYWSIILFRDGYSITYTRMDCA